MKKVVAMLLSSILIISLWVIVPVNVKAAGFDVATWEDFAGVLSLLKGFGIQEINGGTINLTANITSSPGNKLSISSLENPLYINTGNYSINIQDRVVEFGDNVVISGTNNPPIIIGSLGNVVVSGAKIIRTSIQAVIQVSNRGVLTLNSGQINGKMLGISVLNGGRFTATGGLVSTTENNSNCLLIQSTGHAAISGSSIIKASGSNCIGVHCYGSTTIDGTAHIQASGTEAAAIWVRDSGKLTFNRGKAEALGSLSTGVVSSGSSKLYNVNITSESVGMSVTDGQTDLLPGFASIIAGAKYGLMCKGMYNQYSGSVKGGDNGFYLGNGGNAVIYNGSIDTQVIGNSDIFVEDYPVDPSMIIYSAADWNKNIRKSSLQKKIHQIDSFEVISPATILLTAGQSSDITFTVKGVKKDGSLITMHDVLGTGGSFSLTGGNSVPYTVSGNVVEFAPTVAGNGTLDVQDYITWNGWSSVSITAGSPIMLPVASPVASPAGGTFDAPQNVILSCSTAGAGIFYTLNGTEPTGASTHYMSPIPISETATLKAIALKTGMTDSPVISESYAISAEDIAPSMSHFIKMRTYTHSMFTDVDETQWYGFDRDKVVADAYEYGFMTGDSATTFNPAGNITIAEAVTMAARVHSIYNTASTVFTPSNPWYRTYSDYAISKGIIKSYDFSDFNKAATRAEVAYIFSNTLPISEFSEQNTVNSLPDVTTSTLYYSSIYLMYKSGVLSGVDAAGTFRPGISISRTEAAAIISRVALKSRRSSGKVF